MCKRGARAQNTQPKNKMVFRQYHSRLQRLRECDERSAQKFGVYGPHTARVFRCKSGNTLNAAMVIDGRVCAVTLRLCCIAVAKTRRQSKHKYTKEQRVAIKREAKAAKEQLQQLLPSDALCTVFCTGPLDRRGRILVSNVHFGRTNVVDEMVQRGFAVRRAHENTEMEWPIMWQKLEHQRNVCAARKTKELQIAAARTPDPETVRRRKLVWLFCGC